MVMGRPTLASCVLGIGALVAAASVLARADGSPLPPAPPGTLQAKSPPALLEDYCSRCHNDEDKVAGLSIEDLRGGDPMHGLNGEEWKATRPKVSLGERPPRNKPQPDPETRAAFVHWLQASLD